MSLWPLLCFVNKGGSGPGTGLTSKKYCRHCHNSYNLSFSLPSLLDHNTADDLSRRNSDLSEGTDLSCPHEAAMGVNGGGHLRSNNGLGTVSSGC